VFCGTWNVGNAEPPDDLSPFIPLYTADLYVIGVQECQYEPRRDNKSCKVDWQCGLIRHFGRDYTLIKLESLWEIRICCFVANHHLQDVTNVQSFQEATGIAGVLGNKGGTIISLQYKSIKLCFVNSHLAAHQHMCEQRNQHYRTIVKNVKVGPAGQSDILNEYHHVIWMGDLNYRIDYGSQGDAKTPTLEQFNHMVRLIESGMGGNTRELALLFSYDQLAREKRAQRAFVGFEEGSILFSPTFKVKRHTGLEYTPQRSPAWCDRILIRSVPGFPVWQRELQPCIAIGTSDHKPVRATFEFGVPAIPPPCERGQGSVIVRLHDVRCKDLRAVTPIQIVERPRDKSDAELAIAAAKELDPFLVFLAAFLKRPIQTPHTKKTCAPHWMELPPGDATYTSIERIKQTLLYVRVCNHQSQDAIVGRAIIPLIDLRESNPGGHGMSRTFQKRFDVMVTYAGMPAGQITGNVTLMFKPAK